MKKKEVSYFFDVYGPFSVKRDKGSCVSAQGDFWNEVKEWDDRVILAIGCYMFCLSFGSTKITPWYIGMTVAKTGFAGEIFTPHKVQKYNECLGKRNGKPVMFLFPLCTASKNRFSKAYSSGEGVIKWLERFLMAFAYEQYPAMGNIKDMRFLKNTTVRGVFGEPSRGKPPAEVNKACAALFGS
jgi:hypothetical protein